MSSTYFVEGSDLDGMGRPIAVGDLVTADVPVCLSVRKPLGVYRPDAMHVLVRTRDGRELGIATTIENGLVSVLFPEGDTLRVRSRLLRVSNISIESRRNARGVPS